MDFALIMLIALLVTGTIWLFDRYLLLPARRRRVRALRERGGGEAELARAAKEPVVVEYARAFFPVILIVFLLRAFVVEPFRIPSGSMLPSLLIGDFILVNKNVYGIRLPVINVKVIDRESPKRGDVIVFRFPNDPSINYIKRVVGLPGDRISYRDHQLTVNDRLMAQTDAGHFVYNEFGDLNLHAQRHRERLDAAEHDILLVDSGPQPPFEFEVPAGHYFVMGDNRDRSNDSRYWGPVPERNIVGRAFMIWFSWDVAGDGSVQWQRIGNSIQ